MSRIQKFVDRFSLRSKLLTPLIGISVLSFIFLTYTLHSVLTRQFMEERRKQAESIAGSLVYFSDAGSDPLQLQRLVSTLQLEKDVKLIVVAAGLPLTIISSSRSEWLGRELLSVGELSSYHEKLHLAASARDFSEFRGDIKSSSYLTSLSFSDQGLKGFSNLPGALLVTLDSRSHFNTFTLSMMGFTLGLFLYVVIITAIIYHTLRKFVLKPSDRIISAMERRAAGEMEFRLPYMSRDKIGSIAAAMNQMFDELDTEALRRNFAEKELRDSESRLKLMNDQKNIFFSLIAHDLRSPLSSIVGFSRLLQEDYNSFSEEDRKKIIRTINEGMNHTLTLLENLLEWSRLQIGRSEYNPEMFDLNLLALETVSIFRPALEKKQQKVLIRIAEGTMVKADRNMIRTVLRNLLSNALKFSGHNTSVFLDTLQNTSPDISGSRLSMIAVSDQGVGIPKDKVPLLFRIDSGYSTKGTEKERGTGLGLILCREFVEKHGGRIWVESEEGKGSTFKFTLPTI